MLRLSVLITSAFVSAAAPALAEPQAIRGTKDGVSYDGTAELRANGDVEFRGVYPATGERFKLTVTPYGRVRGSVDNRRVRFKVERAAYIRAAAELASPEQVVVIDR